MCGLAAPTEGHGLTRLRIWPEGLTPPERGGFMGPFHADNLAPACAVCNLMKGYRRVRGFVEACRHIATQRANAGDFGEYPQRFRNNTSRRSRSAYITASSTHTKTHALSNETFSKIVARPCHYCGKESDPDGSKSGRVHHNGLDRLDSACRVYTEESCVSCCGDCNIMKYTHSEAFFISHCLKVATHNQHTKAFVGDVEDGEEEEEEEEESKEGGDVNVSAEGEAGERTDVVEHVSVDADGEVPVATAASGSSSSKEPVGASPAILPWDEWDEGSDAELDADDVEEEHDGAEYSEEQEPLANPFEAFAHKPSTTG